MAEGGSFFSQSVGEPQRRAFLELDRRLGEVQATIDALSPAHGDLTGLGDDDHTQYHTDARGDARYLQLSGGTVTGQTTFSATDGVKLTGPSGGVWWDDRNGDGTKWVMYHSGDMIGLWNGTSTPFEFKENGVGYATNWSVGTGSSANAFVGGSNYWRPQDAYGNSYFDINSGSFYVDSANYYFRNASSVNSLTLDSSGNGVLTGHFTANHYYSTSNGAGTNYRLGDDCWIGDVNVANTTRLTGVQNSDRAYIQFGNSGNKLGQAGTGSLTWEGSFWLNGITLSNTDSSGSLRVQGSDGYIDVGPKNSSWCHIYTDRNEFYFNKEIRINNVRVSKDGHTHSYASTSSSVRALYHSGYGNSEFTVYQTSGSWQTWTGGWATHLICNHGNGSNYYNQTLIMPFWGQPHYMRKQGGGNVGPWVMYSSENSNNSGANWTIGRAYVHNEVFVYNMDTTWSYNTVRYNTSNSQLMAYASLREMKTDITEINPLLDYLGERSLLYDLNPVIFKESEDRVGKDGQPLHTTRGEYAPGFIAEEVHEVAPELTYFDHKGDLVSYSNDALIPHIVAELQRLMPMIEELYGAANPDWVPPVPRPVERAEAEKLVYEMAASEKAANPTVFEDQPEGSSFLEPDRDLVDPPEE